jgi:hypothetical protein
LRINIAAFDAFDLDRSNPKIAQPAQRLLPGEPGRPRDAWPARSHPLGLGFFASRVTPDSAAFIILHELSHFAGRANGQEIHDFGRGWFNEPFIAPLKAAQRLANAVTYATFARNAWPTNRTSRRSWKVGPAGVHRRSVFG